MKLTYFQLESHLSKKLAPAYIVSSDELLLKQDASQLIRTAALNAGFVERVPISAEVGFDWEQLHALLHATSLFNEKRLFEINFRDAAPPKVATTILLDYAKNPSANNLLLINLGKADDKINKSAWYTAFEKLGVVLALWPITREQLPEWIMQRAKKYKIDIKLEAANTLADYTEGNLIATAQAIEKLNLLNPTQPIDSQLINTLITDESQFTLFDFIENILQANTARALSILDHLQMEGVEPILVLWAITRELRLLTEMARELKQGSTAEQLFQKYRIFSKRQANMRRFLSKASVSNCQQLIQHAAHIDKIIKGATPGSPWQALQLFCLRWV